MEVRGGAGRPLPAALPAAREPAMLHTRVFWVLIGAFTAILGIRWGLGWIDPSSLEHRTEFDYRQFITIRGAPGEFRLWMYIPEEGPRARVEEESLETADLRLDVERGPEGRRLVLDGSPGRLPRTVVFAARISTMPCAFTLDESLPWPESFPGDSLYLVATDLVQARSEPVKVQLAAQLGIPREELEGELAPGASVAAWRAAAGKRGVTAVGALRRIFDFCQNRITPASFSGRTDALTALRLGEASCGGKSRLMLACARTLGIPGRIVAGVILGNTRPKRTSHVWLELRLGDDWVPFDPLNDHFASLPDNYLILYRGDEPLLRHSRGLAFDYGFSSPREIIPASWRTDEGEDPSGNAAAIPLLRRGRFSIILLAPFALLLVVFARHVVGLQSIGIFLPVLLGFSLARTGWTLGGAQILVAVLLGVALRFLLDRMHLLHVPRSAVLITFVVLLFLVFSAVLERFGPPARRGGIILPMAAIAMTVERFAFVAMDRGNRDALLLLGQTLLLAAGCSVVLTVPLYQALTVAFPEILLVVGAMILVIGNYRGLRLTERWRFRHVRDDGEQAAR